jgi:ABC-type sugar transport system substrate-binding protein
MASGALAADLMGRVLQGNGKVAVTLSEIGIAEHAEKYKAFVDTTHRLYPTIQVVDPVEDEDIEATAYRRSLAVMRANPDLRGIYITTEASMPVLKAARELKMLERLTVLTTDLFPALVREIRSGAVTATIYQRPRTQGRMAFRMLHEFLVEGECPPPQLTLAPHLVMRGNLDFFLQRASIQAGNGEPAPTSTDDIPQYSAR